MLCSHDDPGAAPAAGRFETYSADLHIGLAVACALSGELCRLAVDCGLVDEDVDDEDLANAEEHTEALRMLLHLDRLTPLLYCSGPPRPSVTLGTP